MVKGSHLTDEQKATSSIVHKKAMNRPDVKARISVARMGTTHTTSLKTRAKITATMTGHAESPETRMKISQALRGISSPLWKGGVQVYWRKSRAKRRALGFNPLNSWFVGCDGHHVDPVQVIFIPQRLHRSVPHNIWTGRGMDAINALAYEWLEHRAR